jgi:hypothetical protein
MLEPSEADFPSGRFLRLPSAGPADSVPSLFPVNTRLLPLLALGLGLLVPARAATADVKLTPMKDRVRVEIDGQLFTEYVFGDGASRPYCYPVNAPDGTGLTRDFPQKDTPGEDHDHPWHRSIWFAHSFVNGVDFWNEAGGDVGKSPSAKGRTEHESFIETSSGKVGVIKEKVRWVAPGGKLICTDERTLRFHSVAEGRFIDFEITLQAPANEPLVMGDNKDGTMATRLAQWMTMPHSVNTAEKDANGKAIKKEVGGTGHIITATGERDAAAWGKRADWCDYHATRDGKTYGVAIFDHPKNIQHPTWWMARDYGLFGANPFGWHDYEPKTTKERAGEQTIPAGGTLTLRYRLFFHTGDEKAANVAAHYADYSAGK